MMIGLDDIKKAKQVLDLVADAKALDADGKGGPDIGQFLILGAQLAQEVKAVQGTLAEIEALVGADIEAVKAKLGIK